VLKIHFKVSLDLLLPTSSKPAEANLDSVQNKTPCRTTGGFVFTAFSVCTGLLQECVQYRQFLFDRGQQWYAQLS